MVKRAKYSEIGDVLGVESAFIQASKALDVAGYLAEENRDIDSLLKVAQTWVVIGERLSPDYHEDDDDEEEKAPFGFAVADAVSEHTVEPELPTEEMEEEIEDDEPQD